MVASRQTQNTYEAPLPNTGDASTATFTLMGMSFLALGAVGRRKCRLD
ncbi:LPXTG cell wall anchor domain-containing protein [Streptococcus pluranimalium]